MMGLVDYGSESSSDDSCDEGAPTGILVHNPKKGMSAPVENVKKEVSMQLEDDGFFGDEDNADIGESVKLALPAARSIVHNSSEDVEEEEIEDIVKPKEWEKKLAEKTRRKLEKKAAKRAEKEKRKEEKTKKKEKRENGNEGYSSSVVKKREPVKIAAFGGLNKNTIETEEEENTSIPTPLPTPSSSSLKLFSMLPPPKSQNRLTPSGKIPSLMIPLSLRGKKTNTNTSSEKTQTLMKALVTGVINSDDDDDDDDDSGGDFFGLSSQSQTTVPSTINDLGQGGVPLLPSYGLSDSVGPPRPNPETESSYGYEEVDDDIEGEDEAGPSSSGSSMKTINNEQAQNMIFKYDYAPFGHDRRSFANADIVDVSVDRAIGPNVQENLLKHINHNKVAKASMPVLPMVGAPKDKNAKRKHQITYLANLAVAREEELQQKWAEGKSAKRMARQKYGF